MLKRYANAYISTLNRNLIILTVDESRFVIVGYEVVTFDQIGRASSVYASRLPEMENENGVRENSRNSLKF